MYRLLLIPIFILLNSCIGIDYVDDFVEPEIRIFTGIESLKVGDDHQAIAIFYNNVGEEEELKLNWTSSDPNVLNVDDTGFLTGVSLGIAEINVFANYLSNEYSSSVEIEVSEETIFINNEGRSGMLRTTSSYPLTGTFILKEVDDELILELLDDYETTSALPGLYVYLTNNPSTINNAYEIGRVDIFEGAHTYNLGSQVRINQFNYVLYYCKPFLVKVGDGKIE